MKKRILSLILFTVTALFGLSLSFVLPALERRRIPVAPSYSTDYEIQVDYDIEKQVPITAAYTATTARVTDLLEVRRLTAYNYTPNAYTEIFSQAISNEHNGEQLASRGTIRYVITNIEGISPANGTWEEDIAPYAKYIDDEERLHLTLYLPPMLSACNVFVRVQHEASLGILTGFSSVSYATTDQTLAYDESVRHADGTEGIFLDIPLLISARVWNENPIQNGCVVTIHYEAEEGKAVGFVGTPIIGPDDAVRAIVERGNRFRLVTVLLAIITFFIFVFVCVLKRATDFVPQLVFALAVMVGVYASMSLAGETDVPYVLMAVRAASVGLFLLGAALTLPRALAKIPVRAVATLLSLGCAALLFAMPLAGVASEGLLMLAARIVGAATGAVILACSAVGLLRGKRLDLCINNALSIPLAVYALFLFRESADLRLSPLMWLSVAILGVILVIGFREFTRSEYRNRRLTANLEEEVRLQTKNMQQMIDERERILQFISHDMKKPLSSVRAYLTALRQKETGEEQLKTIDVVEKRVAYLYENLSAVADYAKRKYVAENPVNVSVSDILKAIYAELVPDAEANGIVMELSAKPAAAFAKPDALKSVLQNLVLNAIEHAECDRIWLGVHRRLDQCVITVTDNGKGLGDQDVFRPYWSGADGEENIGLGLYICKSHIEAMNGTLTSDYVDHKLTFTVTLPMA